MQVNQKQLAEVLGVDTRTIRRWQDDGLPHSGSRTDRTYDTADVVRWLVDREAKRVREEAAEAGGAGDLPPKAASVRRREAARARQAELDLAEREGRLVTRDAVVEVMGEALDLVRRDLLNAPGRWGAQLGFDNPRKGEQRLREIVTEVLDRLSGVVADRIEEGGPAALPDAFPGRAALKRAGVETIPQVRRLARDGELEDVRGIGPARERRIREALEDGVSPAREAEA